MFWLLNIKMSSELKEYNTVVSNHFYSVNSFEFSSPRPRDFAGM